MDIAFSRRRFSGYSDNQAKYLRIGWNAAVKALQSITQAPTTMTTEPIDWHPIEQGLPDPDITVLLSLDDTHDEPSWIGFYDGADFRDVSGMPIQGVTDWADMPAGTKRPRGVAAGART